MMQIFTLYWYSKGPDHTPRITAQLSKLSVIEALYLRARCFIIIIILFLIPLRLLQNKIKTVRLLNMSIHNKTALASLLVLRCFMKFLANRFFYFSTLVSLNTFNCLSIDGLYIMGTIHIWVRPSSSVTIVQLPRAVIFSCNRFVKNWNDSK